MSSALVSQAIRSLLSVALLTSGGGATSHWQPGIKGYSVAQVQADLGVLGFNAGPVNGRLSETVSTASAVYRATFGWQSGTHMTESLQRTISAMGTVSPSARGSLVLSVQNDLRLLGLYKGPLNGEISSGLTSAIQQFQKVVGQSASGTLTAQTLLSLAHWSAVRVTAHNHWLYRAEAGDSLSLLAWASGYPYKGFAAANASHGNQVDVGQTIHWKSIAAPAVKVPQKPRASNHPTTPKSNPPASPTPTNQGATPPPSAENSVTGVLSNIKPIADLVVVNPSASDTQALLAQEQSRRIMVDVSVTGQWALLHPKLMHELVALGNQVVISGYSGADLNQLPKWGVMQEINWATKALSDTTNTTPTFLFLLSRPDSTVTEVADSDHLVAMYPNITVGSPNLAQIASSAVQTALLNHPDEVVALTSPVNWNHLFSSLDQHHFIFETLGQIWANQ